MFSGIIKNIAKPVRISKSKKSMEIVFPRPNDWDIELGESINIDGVCSTIKSLDKKTFTVYYMSETLSKTTLSELHDDHNFNLERCLTLNELISGHLVYGHIDTTAFVSSIIADGSSKTITFKLSSKFTKYIVYKGSVAVNGVSLTVVNSTKTLFTASLIPHTLRYTNLGDLKVGSKVNIEVEMMAKYIEKILNKR